MQVGSTVISEQDIQARIVQLGKQITNDYANKGDLVCVGVLKGAAIFMADLVRAIERPVRMEYIALSSYGNETASSGTVKLLLDLRTDIAGKHVLIIEDIVDTGLTMKYLMNMLQQRKPASLAICSLLRKVHDDSNKFDVNYLGFDVSKDAFVVGYGLDYAEQYRNLKDIRNMVKKTE
jgi:hypoxanthine phosphoribosyltransferase